jgi:hypothetical protein
MAGEDMRLLTRFCFRSTWMLLHIKWRPRALRLMNANELPMLQMVQTSCYTLDLMQVEVRVSYSIFVPLELIR